ncbi:MAG: hypothetical protein ACLFWB_12480 [Armatimonadota bacterium]
MKSEDITEEQETRREKSSGAVENSAYRQHFQILFHNNRQVRSRHFDRAAHSG